MPCYPLHTNHQYMCLRSSTASHSQLLTSNMATSLTALEARAFSSPLIRQLLVWSSQRRHALVKQGQRSRPYSRTVVRPDVRASAYFRMVLISRRATV